MSTTAAADRMDDLLRRMAARRRIPHAVAAVERGDGSFRWARAEGAARPGVPMQTDTPFFIASVDKMLTATAILRLREQGAVGLDDRIVDHLPRSLTAGLHRLDGVDRTDSITVRHLLAHASGLPDHLEECPRRGRSMVELLVEGGDRSWTVEDAAGLVREELTPHFPPQRLDGARLRIRYSDTNYVLLIAIVEAATGRALHEVLHEWIFRPLDLVHTYLPGHSSPAEPAKEPAALWFGDEPVEIPLAMASMPAVVSTAADQLRFLRALVRGEVFDDPSTFSLMTERWTRFGFPRDRAALRSPGWPIEYGLGLMRFELSRAMNLGRRFPGIVGHSGSTGSWLFHAPEPDLFLVGTVDQGTAGVVPFRFVPKLLRAAGTAS